MLGVGWQRFGHRQIGRSHASSERAARAFRDPAASAFATDLGLAASLIFLFFLRVVGGGERRQDGRISSTERPVSEQAQDHQAPERQAGSRGFHLHQRGLRRNTKADLKKLGEQGAIDTASLERQIGGGQ